MPDDTPVDLMDLTPRIQAVLKTEGLKTAGEISEIRETADDDFALLNGIGSRPHHITRKQTASTN